MHGACHVGGRRATLRVLFIFFVFLGGRRYTAPVTLAADMHYYGFQLAFAQAWVQVCVCVCVCVCLECKETKLN